MSDLTSSKLEYGLLINFGSFKFEIRKFVCSIGKPRGARRTRRFSGLLVSAVFAIFAIFAVYRQ